MKKLYHKFQKRSKIIEVILLALTNAPSTSAPPGGAKDATAIYIFFAEFSIPLPPIISQNHLRSGGTMTRAGLTRRHAVRAVRAQVTGKTCEHSQQMSKDTCS
jgi:hypothetical protein